MNKIMMMFHPEHMGGRWFDEMMLSEAIKKGWVDSPDKLSTADPVESDLVSPDDRQAAIELYEEKFGVKPHGRMKTETILKALDDNG